MEVHRITTSNPLSRPADDAPDRDLAAIIDQDVGPVEIIRTPDEAKAKGIVFRNREVLPEGSPWHALVAEAPDLSAEQEAMNLHMHGNLHALLAWYENGCDGAVDWNADDAFDQGMKVAERYFPTRTAAGRWVEFVQESVGHASMEGPQ